MKCSLFPRAVALAAATILVQLCATGVAADLVATLPGEFSVDNKGSANYSIPVSIPPGRQGLQPKLSLNYSSGGGNGPLGVGFSLSTGFPQSITRGRSILARDGETRGVTFDNTKDKLYLDGKRLICTSAPGVPYGAPGSTYRTEVDSFVSITTTGSNGNIETFVVTDKSGTKMTFGKVSGADDGYQSGYLAASADTLAYTYALKRVEDSIGNYLTLTYVNPAGGEYQLSRIDYTGGSGISAQAYVEFGYEARTDQPRTYVAGRSFEHSKRLTTITARSKTGADYTVTAAYSLGYSNVDSLGTTTGRSRLMSISPSLADLATGTLCSVPATTVHWTSTTRAYTSQGSQFVMPSNLPAGVKLSEIIWGDFNGDGKTDYAYGTTNWNIYVCLSNGSSFAAPALWSPMSGTRPLHLRSGDIDGDGKTDLIFFGDTANITNLYGLRSSGVSFVSMGVIAEIGAQFLDPYLDPATNTWVTGTTRTLEEKEGEGALSRVVVADFTGDGRDDILVSAYDRYLYLWESNGNSYTPRGKVSGLTGSVDDIGTVEVDWIPNTSFAPRTGAIARFYDHSAYERYYPGPNVTIMPMDVNGDGRMDYVAVYTKRRYRTYSTVYDLERRLQIMVSRPDGTFSAPRYAWYPAPLTFNTAQAGAPVSRDSVALGVLPGDYNGDGLMDFLCLTCGANGADPYWKLILWDGLGYDGGTSYKEYSYVLPITVNIQGETDRTYCNVMSKSLFDLFVSDVDKIAMHPPAAQVLHVMEAGRLFNTFAFDVNGDGLTDLAWYVDKTAADVEATNSKGWYAMLSTGKMSTGVSSGSFTGPIRLADSLFGGPPGSGNMGGEFDSTEYSLTGDLDGDGHPDLFRQSCYNGQIRSYGSVGLACNADLTKPAQFDDAVNQVTDGLGRTTQITYKAAKDDSVYTPGAAVSYPIREIRGSNPVVAEVYKDSGSTDPANRAHFSYQYSGNRLDLSGRGALGFHSFITIDRQTNLFKYQFLAQSFPMTGLTAREQTYRYWEDGSNVKFRLVNSHDNTVVFDEVVNPANATAWGTVYPFISKAIEYRWEDSTAAHFTYTKAGSPESKPEALFTAARPAGHHIAVSAESLFDNQTAAQATIPGSYKASDRTDDWASAGNNTVTGSTSYGTFHSLFDATGYRKITYGNLKKLSTNFGDGFTETVDTAYYAPSEVGGFTGLVKDVTTKVTSSGFGEETAPVKRYTYWQKDGTTWTPLPATEKVDATDDALDLTTTYTHDTLGRVTATSETGHSPNSSSPVLGSTTDDSKIQHIGSFTTASNTAFDGKWDLPTTTQNAYGHTTTVAYHAFLGLPTSVAGPNNDTVTTTYDALGRVVRVVDALGRATDQEYAWTLASATDWKKTVTVTPPSGVTGIASDSGITGVSAITAASVYAIRTTATVQPPVTAYYDRLGRVIRTVKEGFAGQTAVTDTVYNTLGQAIAASLPYDPAKPATGPFWTATTYDALGRVSTVTAPNGTVTTNTYTGRCTTVSVKATDRAAQANTTYVDAKGRTIKVWNADNTPSSLDPSTGSSTTASIEYVLDGFGRMRRTILQGDDTAEHRIEASYDALGRQRTLNDPDKGAWEYLNNALGHVVKQTDAKGTVTLSSFDRLGRPLSRKTTETAGPVETADWYYYDFATDSTRHTVGHIVGSSDRGWIGAPQRETCSTTSVPGYGDPGTASVHYYDTMGRPYLNLNQVDGKYFYTAHDYDTYSRPSAVRYFWRPAGHEEYRKPDGTIAPSDTPYYWNDWGYTYTYDSESYLLTLQDTASTPRTWWQADTTSGYDHLDRPVTVRKGNGHWTSRTYRATDGLLTAIKTGPTVGSTDIQNLGFSYDGLGNLTGRTGAASESFTYDSLNRLTSGGMGYAPNGNLTAKGEVAGATLSNYRYESGRPHAVTGVSVSAGSSLSPQAFSLSFTYDDNGNLLTRTGGGHTWSTKWAGFDKPRWLADTSATGTKGSEFTYNANRSRVVHLEFDAMSAGAPSHYARKKVYGLGPQLEADYANATSTGAPDWKLQKIRIYVPGPEGIVGTMEFNPRQSFDKAETALVYHYDHLGSIERITPYGSASTSGYALDGAGKQSRYSYDAWGQRRNADTWSGPPATTADGGSDDASPRGFTGHEMLDDLGLVHMNGRIYDPLLGRFLSADLIVQSPGNLQAYNRYSYCFNNPLTFTDPSGFETISDYEERAKKLREEQRTKLRAAYAEGGWWGGVKRLFSKENRSLGAEIRKCEDSITKIEDHADSLSRITHNQVDARKLDDVSPIYKLQEAGLNFFRVVPFASVGGKLVTGDYKDAAKDAALQGVFLWAFSKAAGPAKGGVATEERIASEIATAAAEGRRSLAMQFYRDAGYSAEDAASHVAGIDFSKPVEGVVLPKGTQVVQFQIPGRPQGSYYAPPGTSAESIGVNPEGRVQNVFTTSRDVTVLRSTAADTTGNASLPAAARGSGGGTQYFSAEKAAFEKQ
jgi:RHS repeat-associated protein